MLLTKETAKIIIEDLLSQYKLLQFFPIMGAELEFYLLSQDDSINHNFLQDFDMTKEKGKNQFEVRFGPYNDILSLAKKIEDVRAEIMLSAVKHGMKASFAAKPCADEPGSSLQIHFNMLNKFGENLLKKNNDAESELMLFSIGGLLKNMEENVILCVKDEDSFLRYNGSEREAPSKVCWGGNNRTAAIRIPLCEKEKRRIEYRLAAADSCPYSLIAVILFGALDGIKNKILPSEKIYGNAFLEQYNYPLIPNYINAKEKFLSSSMNNYIKEIDKLFRMR